MKLTQLLDLSAGEPALPQDLRGRVRGAQLEAVVRLSPVLMIANVGISATVVATCAGRTPLLWPWAACVWAMAALALRGWAASRRRTQRTASLRALKSLTRQTLLLGLVWSALPPLLMHDGRMDSAAVSISLVASFMACGSFALLSVPAAAMAYALPMAATIGVSMATSDHPILRVLAVLEAAFVILLEALVLSQARQLGDKLVSGHKLDAQRQLLETLLREFETDSSDWRWETGPGHALVSISDPEAARALGRIFGAGSMNDPATEDLVAALRAQAPFEALTLGVAAAGEARWWALSGKPVFDDFGRFEGFRGIGRDVTEARRAQERLDHMARHDALTGLANRAAFAAQVSSLEVEARVFGVLAVDLDRFKAVNDTLGHPAGDALLCEVARRMGAELPEGSIAARLGGDEFAVLAVGLDAPGPLAALAQRLIEAISRPYDVSGQAAAVGASIGVAIGRPGEPLAALRRADLALYRAKAEGRGGFRFFAAEMEEEARRQHALESDLRQALARGEFELHYQPLVDSLTHAVTAFEALLRWRRGGRELQPPSAFIETCEQCGLIREVGAWALHSAVREAATWPADLRVAVNLSPLQFAEGDLVETVRTALEASGLAPQRLELEITEGILITDKDGVLAQLRELKALGVRISLDDFGTGYSSLAYLWQFPFDKLKIDRAFVNDLAQSPSVVDIIRTITALGKTLDLSIVAEGVESDGQAQALLSLACHELQGYHFGKPMPSSDIAPYLTASLVRRLKPLANPAERAA